MFKGTDKEDPDRKTQLLTAVPGSLHHFRAHAICRTVEGPSTLSELLQALADASISHMPNFPGQG